MITALVSGASGVVGYGILRAIRLANQPIRLIGTSIHDNSVAPAFCDIFEKAPKTIDPEYHNWFFHIVAKHSVDIAIPGIEIDMHTWSEARAELSRGTLQLLLNSRILIELCRDKWVFYQDLHRRNEASAIPTFDRGTFEELSHRCGFPFLLKPRCGYGSKGIVRVDSRAAFLGCEALLGTHLIAQPIIGDDDQEYSVSCFGDGCGGFFNLFSLRRKLGAGGFTEWAEVVDSDMFQNILNRLCGYYKPLGPTNFQFREVGDQFKLLEINPRISSATSIRAAFGYNEPLMSLRYFLGGIAPTVPHAKRGQAIRYVEDYIIPK